MRKFRDWMIKNYGKKVWEKYKKAIKGETFDGINELLTLKEIEKRVGPKDWILKPFKWSRNGGFAFWTEIDDKWQEEFKNEN